MVALSPVSGYRRSGQGENDCDRRHDARSECGLRSIVRRDTGESYHEFLTELAQASGIETPTRADLAKLDRKRKHKGSNKDWEHPHDPDARITKMKDGRTHLAHKAEHAVDLQTGAIVAVTLQEADQGDTTTIQTTLPEAIEQLEAVAAVTDDKVKTGEELVTTRVTTASKPCSMYSCWDCAATSANRIGAGSTGSISTPSATQCMPIGVASRVSAGSG